jgi:Zn-dependent protease with chaperone function
MHSAVVVSLFVAAGSAAVSFLISQRMRPAAAARAMTTLAVLSAASTLWALLIVVSANVVQLHGVAERLSWCTDLAASHRETLGPIGASASVAFVAILASAFRVRRCQRRLRAPSGHRELAIVQSEEPAAYALPGNPGQIVVSTGMLRSLAPDERRVLLAHERAHLRCRHHRYVRLTQLSAAAIPVLAPLNARVRHATERWADEEAVREVGDRSVVARAIARAAIAQTNTMKGALGIADTGLVQRIESLLDERPASSRLVELGLTGVITCAAGGLALSVVLIHPWIAKLLGFCH